MNMFEEMQKSYDILKEEVDRAESSAHHQEQLVQERLTLDEIRKNHNESN